jgi:hypothetical protein
MDSRLYSQTDSTRCTLQGICVSLVPQELGYVNVPLSNKVCTTVGALLGKVYVNGNWHM